MSKPKKPVEVVVFNNPWKGKDKNSSEDKNKVMSKPSGTGPSNQRPVFDQKKAKYDIRKLGIHGMDKKNKQNAMTDLLIELGAKPPRNKVYHIKEYQEMAKKKREDEEKIEMMTDGRKKKKSKGKRKRDKDDLLNFVDGQAGFYKDGVQFVKKAKR